MSEEKDRKPSPDDDVYPSKRLDLTLPTNGGVSFVLCGASRSGKSTLMKYLYKTYFASHVTVMFSQNLHTDIYKNMSSKIIVADEYYPEILQESHHINSECANKYPICIISDDIVSNKIKNDMEITRLMTIYRNANMSSILSFQGRVLINSVGRNQANYVFIFKQQTPKEYTNIIKDYLDGWLPQGLTMQERIRWCMVAFQEHQFMVLDNIKGEAYISKLLPDQLE